MPQMKNMRGAGRRQLSLQLRPCRENETLEAKGEYRQQVGVKAGVAFLPLLLNLCAFCFASASVTEPEVARPSFIRWNRWSLPPRGPC